MEFSRIDLFDSREPPLDEDKLISFTRRWNLDLPIDYHRFLNQYNGGKIWWAKNEIILPLTGGKLYSFLKFETGALYTSNPHVYKLEKNKLPESLFPIARTESDKLIYIDCSKNSNGVVYLRNKNIKGEFDLRALVVRKAFIKLGGSFTEFVESLKILKKPNK